MSNSYQLVVQKGPKPGHVFSLIGDAILGRDPLSDIVIDDPEVSRQHARFTLTAGGYQMQDLGSTNGSYIDGTRLTGETVLLNPGQIVMVGSNVMMVYQEVATGVDPMATMVAPMGGLDDPELDPNATALFSEPAPTAPIPPEPEPYEDALPSFDADPEPLPSFDEADDAPLPSFDDSAPSLPSFDAAPGGGSPPSSPGGGSGTGPGGMNRNIIIAIVVLVVLCLCCVIILAILYATGAFDSLAVFEEQIAGLVTAAAASWL